MIDLLQQIICGVMIAVGSFFSGACLIFGFHKSHDHIKK